MTTNLLFHRRTLGKAIECYDFPDNLLTLQARILQWLEPLRSGVLDEVKEVSLHGQFLGDIFGRVLGYISLDYRWWWEELGNSRRAIYF